MPPNTGPITRAAVVIGVDRPGGLKPLVGAAKGAADVKKWLKAEGYHVTSFTDAGGKVVERSKIFKAVKGYVDRGTVEKMVIYFAGHGFLNDLSEVWMLSGAPEDPLEAISLHESGEFARNSNIPNVIFISDTCRSTPQGFDQNRMGGGTIFPNRTDVHGETQVDKFFATRPGYSAVELSQDEARKIYKGLFTEVLKDMHLKADRAHLSNGMIDGTPAKVVTNRCLQNFLPEQFTMTARRLGLTIKQKPQLRLECGDGMFVARAKPAPGGPSVAYRGPAFSLDTPPPPPITLEETALRLLTEKATLEVRGGNATLTYPGLRGTYTDAATELLAKVGKLASDIEPQRFESRTGIRIIGSTALEAVGIDVDTHVLILDRPDDMRPNRPARSLIRVHGAKDEWSNPEGPGSALVQFAEGTSAIIATIPNYVAQVSCEDGKVVNIAYVPAENSKLWQKYSARAPQIEKFRASAAAAAQMGVFAVGRKAANDFGDLIREPKKYDPTLGLYAALAYAEVGLRAEINSISAYMADDIGAILFDIWLLSGAGDTALKRIPICPMLSQSWGYLGPRGVELSKALSEADRENSLWTTFSAHEAAMLIELAKAGTLR